MKISIINKKEKFINIVKFAFQKWFIYSSREIMREFNIDIRNYTEYINKYFNKTYKKSWKRWRKRIQYNLKDEYKEMIFNFINKDND